MHTDRERAGEDAFPPRRSAIHCALTSGPLLNPEPRTLNPEPCSPVPGCSLRWRSLLAVCALLTVSGAQGTEKAPLVDVRKVVPGIQVDLRYNTTDNMFHRRFY